MVEEASLKCRLRKIDETRNCLLHQIKHNYLTSEKYKKTYKYLSYIEHLLILVSIITYRVSISAFSFVVCVPVGITSSAIAIKICAITAGIKRYKSKRRKRKKKKK